VALLAARKADVEALTFLSEGCPRQAPADIAAQAGHLGIAAFLGELQLQQAVQRLRDACGEDRGKMARGSGLVTWVELSESMDHTARCHLTPGGGCHLPLS